MGQRASRVLPDFLVSFPPTLRVSGLRSLPRFSSAVHGKDRGNWLLNIHLDAKLYGFLVDNQKERVETAPEPGLCLPWQPEGWPWAACCLLFSLVLIFSTVDSAMSLSLH